MQGLLRRHLLWKIKGTDKHIFLTFDDGPTPEMTPFILSTLKKHNAKATFFCVGENAVRYPQLMEQIAAQGHSIGNHSHNHLNGWHTATDSYIHNVNKADTYLNTALFRPPYGRISRAQIRALRHHYTIVMWSLLSGDFDPQLSPQQCLDNLLGSQAGDIVVMHDNLKAKDRLCYSLPLYLKHFSEKGFRFLPLDRF